MIAPAMLMNKQRQHYQSIQKMMRGYRDSQILIVCAELNIFEMLAAKGLTANILAEKSASDERALMRLLNAAVGIGLLEKDGDMYINSPMINACLVPNSPFYIGNLLKRENAFYMRWGYLREAVKTGKRPEPNIRDEGQRNWVLDFEMALYDLARINAPLIADALALPEDRPIHILDVGGGHGGYSMALKRRYPNAEITVFELPAAAEVATQIIASENMGNLVNVRMGDFQKEELGNSAYDLILLFGVMVSETPNGKLDLLEKTYRALKPGGKAALREFTLNEERTGPGDGALFSLQMLLSTDAGDLSTLKEMQALIEQAGFTTHYTLSVPEINTDLYLAEKPG